MHLIYNSLFQVVAYNINVTEPSANASVTEIMLNNTSML